MKEKIKTFLAVCVLILTVPYIVTLLFQNGQTSPDREKIRDVPGEESVPVLETGDGELDVEEYLTGIIAKEIPLDYQSETIKAQAVIARTELTAALATQEKILPESIDRKSVV